MPKPTKIVACINYRYNAATPSCAGRGSELLVDRIENGIRDRGIQIEVERIQCLGQCLKGPAMRLVPGGKFFLGVTAESLDGILEELEDLCGTAPSDDLDGENAFSVGVPGS